MQTANEKIKKAIEIFKTQLSGAKGKFRAFVSETNAEQFHSHATARQDCVDRLPRSFLKALANELRIEKPNDEGKVA